MTASEMGKKGGKVSGARRKTMIPASRRREIARNAALTRWGKRVGFGAVPAGNPAWEPTIGEARRLMGVAYEELDAAAQELVPERHRMALREAAEKGWLAVRTAAFAVLRCAGEPLDEQFIARKTHAVVDRVSPTARPFAKVVGEAQGTLHGACFYQGHPDLCSEPVIRAAFDDAKKSFFQAERLCALAIRAKGRR